MDLSSIEREALDWLKGKGGSVLVSEIPGKSERDIVFGTIRPGMTIFRKLEKKGLVITTEEEPVVFDDGTEFEFTPSVDLV